MDCGFCGVHLPHRSGRDSASGGEVRTRSTVALAPCKPRPASTVPSLSWSSLSLIPSRLARGIQDNQAELHRTAREIALCDVSLSQKMSLRPPSGPGRAQSNSREQLRRFGMCNDAPSHPRITRPRYAVRKTSCKHQCPVVGNASVAAGRRTQRCS